MTYHLSICLVITSLTFGAPRLVVADVGIQIVYDTVDSVEIKNTDQNSSLSEAIVVVRGIPSGGSVASTHNFLFGNNVDMATRCERLAVIAMSKPGKFQFAIGSDRSSGNGGTLGHGDCKLILVTP